MRKNVGMMGRAAIMAVAAIVAATPAVDFRQESKIREYRINQRTPLGNLLPRKKKYNKSAKIEMTPMKQIRASRKAKRIKAQRKKDRN
jgi:hypothetical protein